MEHHENHDELEKADRDARSRKVVTAHKRAFVLGQSAWTGERTKTGAEMHIIKCGQARRSYKEALEK